MRTSYVYKVYHGWLTKEPEAEFKSAKKAVEFIKNHKDAEDWCFDKVAVRNGKREES